MIGAEPGSVAGVAEVDPADLSQAIQVYLGSSGPSWSASCIPAARASVLVITVEPPAAGDRIRTLQRELQDRFAEPLRAAGLDQERQRLKKISDAVEEPLSEVVNANPRSPSKRLVHAA